MCSELSKENQYVTRYHASDRGHDHLANKIVEGVAPERFVADERITLTSPSFVPISQFQ
jgi:hypothetical protein